AAKMYRGRPAGGPRNPASRARGWSAPAGAVTENASSMPSKRRRATQAGHDTLKVRDFSGLGDFKSEPIRTVTKIYDNLLFRFMNACSAVAGRPRLHSLSRESELQK